MHVLLTGGCGFVGSSFIRLFSEGEFPEITRLTVLDKLTYAGKKSNIKQYLNSAQISFIKNDICNRRLMFKLIESVEIVINLAAESHVDRSINDSRPFIKTNILGVQTLLDACRQNKQIKFIQVSTDEVYGSISSGSWTENSPVQPNSPYAATKAAADLLVYSYHVTHKLNTIITRCSNNFGPNQFPEKIIPLFINNLMAGRKIPIYGEGKQIRDWLFVEDHCRGIYIAAMRGNVGEIYNIGGGVEMTNLDLTKFILGQLGYKEDLIEHVPDRAGHDFRYSINWDKISKIGYRPSLDFESKLSKTIDWYVKEFKSL